MGGMLYESEGLIEHATFDHGCGRGCGLNMMACVSEI